MTDQPNKPAGEQTAEDPNAVGDRQAVKNQSVVTPEDYPEPAAGSRDQTGKR